MQNSHNVVKHKNKPVVTILSETVWVCQLVSVRESLSVSECPRVSVRE